MIGLGLGLVRQAVRNASGQAWTPAQLFANGEQGVWYEPKPEYLYQDAAGTTPVTADGDPVGLMLDRSRGLELGPELAVEANITLGDWVETADGYSFDSASANLGDGYDPLIVSVPSDKRYQLVFDVVVTGTVKLLIRDGGNANTIAIVSSGSFTFVADSGAGAFEFRRARADSVAFDITNLSVKELPGNHATQSTSAARPTYRTDGTLHWLEFDGVDDYLQLPDSHSTFKFMHDGTGVSVFTAAHGVGETFNPILCTGRASGAAVGYDFAFDNRSSRASTYLDVARGDTSSFALDVRNKDDGQVLPGQSHVFSHLWENNGLPDDSNYYRDATLVHTTGTLGAPAVGGSSYELTVGALGDLGVFGDTSLYGAIIINEYSTPNNRRKAESHLASLAGVAL